MGGWGPKVRDVIYGRPSKLKELITVGIKVELKCNAVALPATVECAIYHIVFLIKRCTFDMIQ